jgi:hypothetical protein
MDNFTQEELYILAVIIGSFMENNTCYKSEVVQHMQKKVYDMIDNYCDHEFKATVIFNNDSGSLQPICIKCGNKPETRKVMNE